MRCQKCGKISFDSGETCRFCNADLKESRILLGGFPPEPQGRSWFDIFAELQERNGESTMLSAADPPFRPDISGIDVSDLLAGREDADLALDLTELDPVALQSTASDDAFQRALGQVVDLEGDKGIS